MIDSRIKTTLWLRRISCGRIWTPPNTSILCLVSSSSNTSRADVAKIANAYYAWRQDGETNEAYQDVAGFCRAAKPEEIQKHDYVLTPGRYVGAEDTEEDSEAFAEKMQRLTAQLGE